MLSRGGFELNEIWDRQVRCLGEAEGTSEDREERVLNLHGRGDHHDVIDTLLPHHSTMSDKEREVYDKSMKAMSPPPKRLADRVKHSMDGKLAGWVMAPGHYPKKHIFAEHDKMDEYEKKAHAHRVAKTWDRIRDRSDMDDKGFVTVYRRPTPEDAHRGFKGRESGHRDEAAAHQWGGSSWSLNPWHVGQEIGDRPGLKTRVHHSQVMAHPGSHKSLNQSVYRRESEVILRPDAQVKAEPCGGDPEKSTYQGNCHDQSPEKVRRLQRDAQAGRPAGSKIEWLLHKGKFIVEADEHLRNLERAASSGDPEAVAHHHQALIRAGRSGDVMAQHVLSHAKAKTAYDDARKPENSGAPPQEITDAYNKSRSAIRNHYKEHGDHPADHAHREKGETPRAYGDLLVDLTLANGTVRPGGSSEHDHGTLSYENHHDKDKQEHYRKRDAMARAWKREVPEGHVSQGDRTFRNQIRGSYVSFRTGAHPEQRQRR